MSSTDNAIIEFDDAGNLDLFGHNEVLSKVFRSSDSAASFRRAMSDFDLFAKCCPEMVAFVNELLPTMPQYVADLPTATLRLMKEGKLFLRPDKEGKLLATLINSENQKIDKIVRLKEAQHIPAVNDMMFSLSFMAITQQLNEIQEGIAELRQGQIHDREKDGMVAAQKLQWAAAESDPEKRKSLCSEAHSAAMSGFFACLNTVEESVDFFLSQPSSNSLIEAIAQQIAPWNWGNTFRALTQMQDRSNDLQRSIAKCTYCTQYAAASSFILEDRPQAARDLKMFSEHMSRIVLGEKAEHLRPWLSPRTMESLPMMPSPLPPHGENEDDLLSYVENTVARIEAITEMDVAFVEEPSDGSEMAKTLLKE